MKVKRGYKYALRLSGAQRSHFAREFGASRLVFNKLLEKNKAEYELFKDSKGERPVTSYFSLAKKLIPLKEKYPCLKDNSVYTLRDGCHKLGNSLTNFLKGRARYPNFKSKRGKQSVTYNRTGEMSYEFALREIDGKVFLKCPKLKSPIKVLWHRELPSAPSQCTISRDTTGEFWVSFLCERDPRVTTGTEVTGIDLGLRDIATTSDGVSIEVPRYFRRSAKRLAIAQRKLAKKSLGSRNRSKQRSKVAKIHKKVANQRKHLLHSLSRNLVNDNQVISLETLNVRGMSRALHLGKSVSDAGLGKLKDYIFYKAGESLHCKVLMYPAFLPSTQACSKCYCRLTKDKRLDMSVKSWVCPGCNEKHHRDINAAKILKEAAVRYLDKFIPKDLKHRHGVIIIDTEIDFNCLFPESINYS